MELPKPIDAVLRNGDFIILQDGMFVGVGTLGSRGQRVGSTRRNTCPNFSNTLDTGCR